MANQEEDTLIRSDSGGDENSRPNVVQNHNRGQMQRHMRLPKKQIYRKSGHVCLNGVQYC